MKLLGRRSLSTFLRLLTSAAFYVSILGAVLLAVVLTLIATLGGDNATESFPIAFSLDDSAYSLEPLTDAAVAGEITEARGNLLVTRKGDGQVSVRFVFVFPVIAAVIFTLSRLRLVFRRFEEERPFAPENAGHLRLIGITVIVTQLVWSAVAFWTARLLASEFSATGIVLQPTFDVRMPLIMAGLVVLIVAEVFRIGAVMKSDLDTAHDIQVSLLPPGEYQADGISIHARMRPARAVGGDYYDIVPLDDGRLAFVVADVAGKAIPVNPSDEEFGESRIEALVRAKADDPASGLLDRIDGAVAAFCGSAPQADDMTMMVVSRAVRPRS